jgi:hypothetical protein
MMIGGSVSIWFNKNAEFHYYLVYTCITSGREVFSQCIKQYISYRTIHEKKRQDDEEYCQLESGRFADTDKQLLTVLVVQEF